MKTNFEYYYFTKAYDKTGDIKWYCNTTVFNITVGTVNYSKLFNNHIFMPYSQTGFSVLCLNDISQFISQLYNQ